MGAAQVGAAQVGVAQVGFGNVRLGQIQIALIESRYTPSHHRQRGLDIIGRWAFPRRGFGAHTHECAQCFENWLMGSPWSYSSRPLAYRSRRCSEEDAHPAQGYLTRICQKSAETEVATKIASDALRRPSTMRRKPVSVKRR